MFTGIVETAAKTLRMAGGVLELETPHEWIELDPMTLGESVAVNGCCLTAVQISSSMTFDLSPETLRRTSLGDLKPGDPVNLERAMRLNARLGGHIVQGHVDACGRVISILERPDSWIFRFQAPREYDRYLIDKGSVCVDGVSLTICEPADGAFDVWIIPHTFEVTNFSIRKPGDRVNLEFDVLAKHIEKLLGERVSNG